LGEFTYLPAFLTQQKKHSQTLCPKTKTKRRKTHTSGPFFWEGVRRRIGIHKAYSGGKEREHTQPHKTQQQQQESEWKDSVLDSQESQGVWEKICMKWERRE
jgi:hypothetical protein